MSRIDRFGRSTFAGVVAVGLLVLGLIAAGVSTLAKGRLHYGNYWGGSVFAPFALLIAAIIIVVLVVSRLRGEKPAKKLRGRAARKARRVAASFNSALQPTGTAAPASRVLK